MSKEKEKPIEATAVAVRLDPYHRVAVDLIVGKEKQEGRKTNLSNVVRSGIDSQIRTHKISKRQIKAIIKEEQTSK